MERKIVSSESFEAEKINLPEKTRKKGARNEIQKTRLPHEFCDCQ